MKNLTIILINAAICVPLLFFLLSIEMFHDVKGPLPLPFRIFEAGLLAYPIIFLASLLLSYLNKNLIYISFIGAILPLSIMGWFLFDMFIIYPRQLDQKNRQENFDKISKASHDFACNDGTFFSKDKQYASIQYYGLEVINHPENIYWPQVGEIKNGKLKIYALKLFKGKAEERPQVIAKLSQCKNKEGKTLVDLYGQPAE